VRTQAEIENVFKLIEAIRLHAERNSGAYPAKIEDLVQKNIISKDEFTRLTTSPLDLSGLSATTFISKARTSTAARMKCSSSGRIPSRRMMPAELSASKTAASSGGSVRSWTRF